MIYLPTCNKCNKKHVVQTVDNLKSRWNNCKSNFFKDTDRGKAPSNETPALAEITNMGIWVVVTTNELFLRVLKLKQNFQKNKYLLAKLSSFVVTILFVLSLASDMAVWYGNDAFSILVLSTKKRYFSFLKKVFVFHKIYFKVKLLKTFKIFNFAI